LENEPDQVTISISSAVPAVQISILNTKVGYTDYQAK